MRGLGAQAQGQGDRHHRGHGRHWLPVSAGAGEKRREAGAGLQRLSQRPGGQAEDCGGHQQHPGQCGGPDLASIRHVSTFAWNIVDKMQLDRVDVLINAAATAPRGIEREVTTGGLERVMATNLLGPLHLATRLMKAFSEDAVVINLVEAEPDNIKADIDNINSAGTYDAGYVYQLSKYYLRLRDGGEII